MTVTVIERPKQAGEAHFKRPTSMRDYVASGTFDRNEAILAIANASPQFDQGMDLQTGQTIQLYRNKVDVREMGGGVWEASVRYESSSDSVELSFSFGTQTGKVFVALEHVASYDAITTSGVTGTDHPDFERAIGVQGDKIEGVEIEVGKVEFAVTKKWKRAILPATYITTIADLTDRSSVNHATFTFLWMGQTLSFTRGNLRLRTVSVKQNSDEELEISYHFHYARPIVAADNYTVGSSVAIEKEGHHYMWTHFYEDVSAGVTTMIPWVVCIERVYEYKNFGLLNIS
jgi:hypothetical protein